MQRALGEATGHFFLFRHFDFERFGTLVLLVPVAKRLRRGVTAGAPAIVSGFHFESFGRVAAECGVRPTGRSNMLGSEQRGSQLQLALGSKKVLKIDSDMPYPSFYVCLFLIALIPPLPGCAGDGKPDLECQIERSRKQRIEGGDFDDKTERVSFDIKLTNKNWKEPVEGVRGIFYIFGESVHDRKAFKLVLKEDFDVHIEPRGTFETSTPVATMMYDTTGASFGEKYRGWVLVLENRDGDTFYENASSVFMKETGLLAKLGIGDFCDREGKPVPEPQRAR